MTPAAVTLLSPWALVGLVLLPVLWWIHRRAERPPTVEVPSLLFLEAEAKPESARVARRFDPELWLSLATALLLVLAATQPVARLGAPGRTVRVATFDSGLMTTFAGRRDAALEEIRRALDPSDRLDVASEERLFGRPSDVALLAAARAGPAALRLVVSDRLPEDLPADVRWVALGDPRDRNLGIVAAGVEPLGSGIRVFANVLNDGPEALDVALRVTVGITEADVLATRLLAVPAGGLATATIDLAEAPGQFVLLIEEPPDAMQGDGLVAFRRTPVRIRFDAGLPASHRGAVERALGVILGPGGYEVVDERAELLVVPSSRAAEPYVGLRLAIGVLPAGARGAAVPDGVEVASTDALAADLSVVDRDLVYAPGTERVPPGSSLVLGRRVGAVVHPVVIRIHAMPCLVPDPLAGARPLVDGPFWPLFLENALRELLGAPLEGGYRSVGQPDPESSRVGRDLRPFDPAWLAAAPVDRAAPERPLGPWLAVGALLGLAALWLGPLLWNRRAPLPRGMVGS